MSDSNRSKVEQYKLLKKIRDDEREKFKRSDKQSSDLIEHFVITDPDKYVEGLPFRINLPHLKMIPDYK